MRARTMGVALVFVLVSVAYGSPRILTYQGSLLRPGGSAVADGTYDMRFSIYDVALGGSSLWTETDAGVQVTGGLFLTILGDGTVFSSMFFPWHYDLWLEVEIDADHSGTFDPDEVFAPRQRLTAAPWAMDADRLNGRDAGDFVAVTGDQMTGMLHIHPNSPQTGLNNLLLVQTNAPSNVVTAIEVSAQAGVPGQRGILVSASGVAGQFGGGDIGVIASSGAGVGLYADSGTTAISARGDHIGGCFETGTSRAVLGRATASDGSAENYGGYFTAAGGVGRGVYGEATNTGAVQNYGGYFTAAGSTGRGAYGEANGASGHGVHGEADGTSGHGVHGEAYSPSGHGVHGKATGLSGIGVRGEATYALKAQNYGGYFTAAGTLGQGVFGEANGAAGHGVHGEADGSSGHGVHGQTTSAGGYGVYGSNSHETGAAIRGEAGSSANNTNYGGYFTAGGLTGRAVYGEATNLTGTNHGGYFLAKGDTGHGVHALADHAQATAVYAEASASNIADENYGGHFLARGGTGRAVWAEATHTGAATNYGGYFVAQGTTSRGVRASGKAYSFYAAGPVGSTDYGTFTGGHEVRLAAEFPANVAPGMVVAVTGEIAVPPDEEGIPHLSATLPTVRIADKANDKAVLGVLVRELGLPDDHWYPAQEGERFATVNAVGEGRVWVCSANGSIEAGDYITTSDVPGYGQRQDDDVLRSCTLGKATESVDWDTVTETIEVGGEVYKVYLLAVVYTSG